MFIAILPLVILLSAGQTRIKFIQVLLAKSFVLQLLLVRFFHSAMDNVGGACKTSLTVLVDWIGSLRKQMSSRVERSVFLVHDLT